MLNLEYCKKCPNYAKRFFKEELFYCLREVAELEAKKFNLGQYGFFDDRSNAYISQPQFLSKPPESCTFLLEQTLS